MKKFLIIAAVLLVVGFVVAKNKQVCSYVCTSVKMVGKQFKGHITPEFEIERLKGEIAKLDSDIENLITSEANVKVDLTSRKAELAKKEAALSKNKLALVSFAEEVKKSSQTTVATKKKLTEDFELYKSQTATVESLKDLLAAKEKHYNALVNQRNSFLTKKQTYTEKLTKLEADWINLKNQPNATVSNFDNNRFNLIEQGLKNLKHEVDVEREIQLIKGEIVVPASKTPIEEINQIDPDTVLNAILNSPEKKNTVENKDQP